MAEPEEKRQTTPFDHPLFLPALLLLGFIWFGYDGWISTKFLERPGTLWFNRIGSIVLLAFTIVTGVRGLREYREDQARNRGDQG